MARDALGVDWWWIGAHGSGWSLVLARVAGLCFTAPVIAVPGLDFRFRFGLSVLLTLVIAPVVAASPDPAEALGWAPFTGWLIGEIVTGIMLGWTAGLMVAGAQLAGDLVAAQAGLSASTFFDPETGEEMTAVGRLYGWLALMVFVTLDGPLQLVRSVTRSYQLIPAGGLSSSPGAVLQEFAILARVLELAVRAAAPVATALLVAGIVIGWLSRAAPSVPLVALTLPVRALVGIVLVLLGLSTLAVVLVAGWEAFGYAF